jgi:hypothetical protein
VNEPSLYQMNLRLVLYRRQGRLCSTCERTIALDEAELVAIDPDAPLSAGNAVVECLTCHARGERRKGKRRQRPKL